MNHVHLATALVVRDGCVLLVASHYPNHPQPLWNLPGGRQHDGELLSQTAERECLEETGIPIAATELAYVSESYDRADATHFVNATFVASVSREGVPPAADGDHVVAVEWVRIDEVASRVAVSAVREPLLAYLRGELPRRYVGYDDAGITIRWPRGSA
jgi:ADP-ribose pyrophosphatase YjhB (NUDIX family)